MGVQVVIPQKKKEENPLDSILSMVQIAGAADNIASSKAAPDNSATANINENYVKPPEDTSYLDSNQNSSSAMKRRVNRIREY